MFLIEIQYGSAANVTALGGGYTVVFSIVGSIGTIDVKYLHLQEMC